MKEKAAYLRGTIEGLGIDETTKEGKVIKAMSELLGELAEAVDGIDEDVTRAYDQINDTRRGAGGSKPTNTLRTMRMTRSPKKRKRIPKRTTMTMISPVSRSMRWPAPTAARPFTSARTTWTRAKQTAPTAA